MGVHMISLTRKHQAYHWVFMLTSIEKIWFIFPLFSLLVPTFALHPAVSVVWSLSSDGFCRLWCPSSNPAAAADSEPLRDPVSVVVQRGASTLPTRLKKTNACSLMEENLKLHWAPGIWTYVDIDLWGRVRFWVGDLEHFFLQSSEKSPGNWEYIAPQSTGERA